VGLSPKAERKCRHHPPVVLVWSAAGQEEFEHARALGAADCLRVGACDPQELLDTIERLIQKDGLERELSAICPDL
jgi:hypothetical protein